MSLVFPPSEMMRPDFGHADLRHVDDVPFVLIVEDEESVGYFLQRSIEAAGHRVRVARSAEEAARLVRERAPLVVVCDIHLPGANGFWLAEQVRTLAPTTAVVLMTGDDQAPAANWIREGVIAFLIKPVTRGTLMAVLEDALRWSAERQDQVGRERRDNRIGPTATGAEEPKVGDVLIERTRGAALCVFGLVRQNGLRPARLRSGTLSEARHWAEQMLAGTGGQTRELAIS